MPLSSAGNTLPHFFLCVRFFVLFCLFFVYFIVVIFGFGTDGFSTPLSFQ